MSRRKRRILLLLLLAAALAVLLWMARGPGPIPPIRPQEALAPGPPFEYRGAIHCHSTFSDGGKSVREIGGIGDRLGLDFVFVTDHDNLDALPLEGMVGRCRVLAGTEVSTDDGHLLALGVPATAYRLGGDGEDVIADIRALGGMAVVPHPRNDRFSWTAPPGARPDGIEVLNGDSAWRNAPAWKLLAGLPLQLVRPQRTMLRFMADPRDELRLWDRYLEAGPTTGLAGADTHGRVPILGFSIPFPRYEDSLGLFTVHVLTGQRLEGPVDRDKRAIVEALRSGACFVSVRPLGDASGFRFDGRRVAAADGGFPGPLALEASVPGTGPVRTVLLRSGAPILEGGRSVRYSAVEPGSYRVEVYAGKAGSVEGRIPWIVSSAIRNGLASPATLLRELSACPRPDSLILHDFEEDDPGLALEGDPATLAGTGPLRIETPDESSGRSLALRFRMPSPFRRDGFWALSDRAQRDLRGFAGLSLRVRSDLRLRLKIQVREQDPKGEEGAEWFASSFISEPQWQCVSVPFGKLRCVSRGADGRLDPSRVAGIFFIGHSDTLNPGVAGTVWIDDIRAYPPQPPAATSNGEDSSLWNERTGPSATGPIR